MRVTADRSDNQQQGGQHTKSKNGLGSFNDADLGAVAEMSKVLLAREKNHTIPGSPPGL